MRVPDGQISCHANQSRIGEIPRDDPANWLFSENVESFAVSHGWYDPKSGQPFRFFEAYCPPTPLSRRICDARVWSILRRAAPSQHLSPDYHRSKPGSQPYPLSLPPDDKLSVADVFALMRDHYEGTEFDMTQGHRRRPLRTAAALASADLEGRRRRVRLGAAHLDPADRFFEHHAIAGVAAEPDRRPGLVRHGRQLHHLLFAVLLRHRRGAQELRGRLDREVLLGLGLVGVQPRLELCLHEILATSCRRFKRRRRTSNRTCWPCNRPWRRPRSSWPHSSPNLMTRYLTDYSVMHAEQTVSRWQALIEHLITKYNDGYVRDEQGKYPDVGYPEAWLRRVIRERPEQFRLPVEKPKEKAGAFTLVTTGNSVGRAGVRSDRHRPIEPWTPRSRPRYWRSSLELPTIARSVAPMRPNRQSANPRKGRRRGVVCAASGPQRNVRHVT